MCPLCSHLLLVSSSQALLRAGATNGNKISTRENFNFLNHPLLCEIALLHASPLLSKSHQQGVSAYARFWLPPLGTLYLVKC